MRYSPPHVPDATTAGPSSNVSESEPSTYGPSGNVPFAWTESENRHTRRVEARRDRLAAREEKRVRKAMLARRDRARAAALKVKS